LKAVRELARNAERPEMEPTLVQYDQWGRRIDQLLTSEGWRGLKAVAAEEGYLYVQSYTGSSGL
jgi:hypothetical protein